MITSHTGSSTACILAFDNEERRLYTANLGDSGFLIMSAGKIIHRSKAQEHAFNTPYQLAFLPEGRNNKGHIQDKWVFKESCKKSCLVFRLLLRSWKYWLSDRQKIDKFSCGLTANYRRKQSSTLPCCHHRVEDADVKCFNLLEGDIVLCVTDGLLDNMYNRCIMEELKKLEVVNQWLLVTVS